MGWGMAHLTSKGISIEASGFRCWGPRMRVIPYDDILHFEQRELNHYLVKYIHRNGNECRLRHSLITLTEPPSTSAETRAVMDDDSLSSISTDTDIERLVMKRSFQNSPDPRTRKPILVLINPKSGPGNAKKHYEEYSAPIFAAAGIKTEVITTSKPQEGCEIAEKASTDTYDVIVCVSGDGLVHEVLNGLGRRADAKQALQHFSLAQLPGGSGNGLALSLNGGNDDWGYVTLGIVKSFGEPYDLMEVTQNNNRCLSFLSLSFGIVADCDLGTEDMRWMGGARFTVGIVLKCLAENEYPCKIAYCEAQAPVSEPRITVNDPLPANWVQEDRSHLSMFYAGKMPWMSSDAQVFPRSDQVDGLMDLLVWDSSIGALTALGHLMRFEAGTHVDKVPFYKKVAAFRLTPAKENYLSIDGESYPCMPVHVSVLPEAGRFIVNKLLKL